jgi:hypothetical protein
MTVDSVFWIASMTKAITAAGAMQLVEQGKLSLDAPIGKVLPDLAAPQVLEGFDAQGAPKLRPAKNPITLRHLMTHTRFARGCRGIEPLLVQEQTDTLVMKSLENAEQVGERSTEPVHGPGGRILLLLAQLIGRIEIDRQCSPARIRKPSYRSWIYPRWSQDSAICELNHVLYF